MPTPPHPITISLENFEGPLDLLLYLVTKHEIDIYNIPIAPLTTQYIHNLKKLKALNPQQGGNFLVMTATLMHIKSRMLLPKDEQPDTTDDDTDDPRWELVEQLLEYKALKECAIHLQNQAQQRETLIPIKTPTPDTQAHTLQLKKCQPIDLWRTFNQTLHKLTTRLQTGKLHEDPITIAQQMEFLLNQLQQHPQLNFNQLFNNTQQNWTTITATFLAMLELARLDKLTITQQHLHGPILLTTTHT